MSPNTDRTTRDPRRLPTVRLNGVDYFIDERLGEFRPVWNPHHRVEFNSAAGVAMLHRIAIVTCPDCGQELGVPLAPETGADLVCPTCLATIGLARLRPLRCG